MNEATAPGSSQRPGRRRAPIGVIGVAALYLAVGVGTFIFHFKDLRATDGIWLEATELLAVVCGLFLLRAQNWARWLAIAWMTFHVLLSLGDLRQLAVHGAFLLLIVWALFRADANRFFRPPVGPGRPSADGEHE
jgi:hypothetical protein